jgi:two-component system phosphate regulon sensor histidine kinase PhoR
VNFPDKNNQLIGSLGIWLYSSVVLLLVVGFFAFALIAIFRQKQLSEVQKDFVNNMTHELKTPVSTILVSSRLLSKPEVQQDPASISQYVSLIQHEAERLKSQVERVLQVAVWDEKHLKYQFEEIDLHECLDRAINSVEQIVKEKNGSITRAFGASNTLIRADRMHFTNVFFNLLDNAVKYCQKTPLIEVSTSNSGSEVSVAIKDNGIGMEKKNLNRIFERFFRVHTGDIHDVKGFGLGLYYVSKVIKDHGGKIKVHSEVNKGTTFIITLPL